MLLQLCSLIVDGSFFSPFERKPIPMPLLAQRVLEKMTIPASYSIIK